MVDVCCNGLQNPQMSMFLSYLSPRAMLHATDVVSAIKGVFPDGDANKELAFPNVLGKRKDWTGGLVNTRTLVLPSGQKVDIVFKTGVVQRAMMLMQIVKVVGSTAVLTALTARMRSKRITRRHAQKSNKYL